MCRVASASSFGFNSSFVIRASSFNGQKRQYACNNKDVYQRDLEEKEPAESHELVPAESGQRPAHPHEHENEGADFGKEHDDVDQPEDPTARTVGDSRKVPAAEKKGHHNRRAGNHRDIFAKEKQTELH